MYIYLLIEFFFFYKLCYWRSTLIPIESVFKYNNEEIFIIDVICAKVNKGVSSEESRGKWIILTESSSKFKIIKKKKIDKKKNLIFI